MDHSPAYIVRDLLVGEAMITKPSSNSTWPGYVSGFPRNSTTDNIVVINNTTAKTDGRIHTDGEQQEHEGIQIIVRGDTYSTGYTKANALKTKIDTGILRSSVTIGGATYMIQSISRVGGIIELDEPNSTRKLFSLNALMSVCQTV